MMSREELLLTAERALNTIRPAMEADGGGVDVVSYDDVNNTLAIRFKGACINCPSQKLTFGFGIEKALKQYIPNLEHVVINR